MFKINDIVQGDSLTVLKTFPDNCVDSIITSPPYWALRDYGIKEQLGLETSFKEYLNKLCDVFDELKRVLKPTGTCWVNLGDTYYSVSGGKFLNDNISSKNKNLLSGVSISNQLKSGKELTQKNLCNIPARFSIAMQDRGWILRNEIIWHKPNCMPSSVKDRFTVDFEKIFFFVKNKKYYFDTQRTAHKIESVKRACRARSSNKLKIGKYAVNYLCKNTSYNHMEERLQNGELRLVHKNGRNMRCVWNVPTKSFHGAHFAVYPENLIITMIKAGCPINGIVLDPFIGSGTTALVALRFNRQFIGIELNPDYVFIAKNRIKPFLEQKKLSGGVF